MRTEQFEEGWNSLRMSIQDMLNDSEFNSKKFIGIDYSSSAIEYASNDNINMPSTDN